MSLEGPLPEAKVMNCAACGEPKLCTLADGGVDWECAQCQDKRDEEEYYEELQIQDAEEGGLL